MQINRNNYGAFFLDYWESNLDEQGGEALALFLEKNPDLQDEFFGFKAAAKTLLTAEAQLTFAGKQRLKKIAVQSVDEITQDTFENYIIAFLENDLTENQLKMFARFRLVNPEIENEIELYKKTYLKPDRHIVYQNKTLLKRRVLPLPGRQAIIRGFQIAAVLLIAFGLFRLTTLLFTPEVVNPEMSEYITTSPESEQRSSTFAIGDNLNIRALDFQNGFTASVSDQPEKIQAPELRTSKTIHFEKQWEISETGRQKLAFIHLPGRPAPSFLPTQKSYPPPVTKNEFSAIFNYLLVRDGLAGEKDDEKGFFGRLVAGLGNTLIKQREQPIDQLVNPVYAAVTDRGKGLLSFASEALPLYQTIDETGRKETYFAINENFNILLSRSQTGD